METVATLLSDAREREHPLFTAPDRATPMTGEEAVTSAWQMGNLLRHYGVRPGERVAIVPGPTEPGPDDEPGHLGASPVPVLATLGAMATGGVVDLDPPAAVDATVLIVPAAWIDDYQPGPGTTAIAYGDAPEESGVAHLEREAWSENPTEPPADLDPTTPALAGDRTYVHGDLVSATRRIVHEHDLDADDRIALSAPLTAGALVAGVFAPLAAGGTVVLTAGSTDEPTDVSVIVEADVDSASPTIDPYTALDGRNN